MPALGVAFALLMAFALAAPLRADLKIRIQETFGPSTSSRTEYYKDRLWRRELDPATYLVMGASNRRNFQVETQRREYVVQTPGRPLAPVHSSDTFVVELDARDTGEQRQVFGHNARHFISTEHRRMEHSGQSPSAVKELVTDGWYLDIPGRFPGLSGVGVVTYIATSVSPPAARPFRIWSPANRPPEAPFAIKITGNRPPGLAIWEKTADHLLEVTELSEDPLDPTLFEPPPGFRRVIRPFPGQRLSWADQAQFYLQQFLDWLGIA